MAKAIKKYGREKFVIATKVPSIKLNEKGEMERLAGSKENIKAFCDLSLKRLEIDCIDLYY